MILVTGGCGFIGSAFILDWLAQDREPVLNLDLLTYAGHPGNLQALQSHSGYRFVRGDIGDQALLAALLREHRPRAIVHLAAESHVDRSIAGPDPFIQTNVVGTTRLLQAAHGHWSRLPPAEAAAFRFLNVSTDEVFGSLGADDPAFSETHPYRPNSPYSASKASADHFARAWCHTFGLPVITTNCSNNYGPRQFPEKLIPLVIHHALAGRPLPVYGDGLQVRDWLHVNDHCSALRTVLDQGRPGETYNIGGRSERTNLEVVHAICRVLDEARPGRRHAELIRHVDDRCGHDRRYAIDDRKIASQLGWKPAVAFEQGIRDTVQWYLANSDWVASIHSGAYRQGAPQSNPARHSA
ncbi:dTDP-glucose 4,6-dehydratase [Ramlibacter tataouinensis]|uniref:dTDP-glucose 4,6-dehydratase n=1 Tax=Ramlibacter tataouinensis TaxID=94132 RepID=UPI0022F3C57B|nr:dTDP-glucose 4,6-dehydratase [Ramlibacter tataouinensis]WBY03339.1 dTDP-glucose 4,6-dehydratase [Ramlibacter tataouinensis]